MSSRTLLCRGILAVLTLAFAAACDEAPTESLEAPEAAFAKGKPADCGGSVPLSITIDDAVGNAALLSDDRGAYVDSPDSVGAHISGNGNLMFWTSQYGANSRYVKVNTVDTTAEPDTLASRQTTDRIFTNTHENAGGGNECGLSGMAVDSAGSAVFVVELGDTGEGFVRYGQDCDGNRVEASRVSTQHPDADTWEISGISGVHCKSNGLRGKRAELVEVGTAGPFFLTLMKLPG